MKRLWIAFTLVMVLSFLVLGWIGTRIYQEMPPLPAKVVTTDGTVLVAEGEIQAGQNVWQSLGGMEVGSVWGHGSYVAPDWTADWLHREATFILDRWANAEFGTEYAKLDGEQQAQLQGRLANGHADQHLRPGHAGPSPSHPIRAEAFQANLKHYSDVFANGKAEYAIPAGAVTDPDRLRKLSAFFFWTSWAASTNRPNEADHLHEQLALRAAGRQPAHGRNGRLDRREHHHAAGGHLGDGLVVRRPQEPRRSDAAAGNRPAGQLGRHAVAEGDRQILLGRVRPDSRADVAGRRDGPLRRRGGRVLRHPALRSGCRTA